MRLKLVSATIGALCLFLSASSVALATTFYISPNGNDNNNGTSLTTPFQTFSKAKNLLYPGDILYFLDGEYDRISIAPARSGTADQPITFKAYNDGKAILDGEFETVPIKLVNPTASKNHIFEGFVVKNGGEYLNGTGGGIYIDRASDLIFRRISSYNADPDKNTHPIMTYWSSNIVFEDCIAAGTGRKMIEIYFSDNITVRRCFSNWTRYDGALFSDHWPNSEGIDLYGSNNSTVENSINYANVPTYGFTIRAKDPSSTGNNNKILGSISVLSGIDQHTGQLKSWPPNDTHSGGYVDVNKKEDTRVGLRFFAKPTNQMDNNLVQDFLAYGNANPGIDAGRTDDLYNARPTNNRLVRVTLYGNMRDSKNYWFPGGISVFFPTGIDMYEYTYDKLISYNGTINDSYIGMIWNKDTGTTRKLRGSGAKYNLLNRHYVDGQLREGSFWNGDAFGGTTDKWPMEDRARAEYKQIFGIDNFSITNTIKPIIQNAPSGSDDPPPLPTTGPSPTPMLTPTQVPTAIPIPKPNEIIPLSVSSTTHLDPYVAQNSIDKDSTTRWSGDGNDAKLVFELSQIHTTDLLKIAWHNGDSRNNYFDILQFIKSNFNPFD